MSVRTTHHTRRGLIPKAYRFDTPDQHERRCIRAWSRAAHSRHHHLPCRNLARAGLLRSDHELRLGEFGEAAALGDELVEGAGLDDTALVEDEDAVGVADGRQAVGDNENGAVL